MENFGTRLSVDDIWKVVLFLKTIPSGSLQADHVLSVDDYYQWHPTPELLQYVEKHPVQDMQAYQGTQQGVNVTKADGTGLPDPFLGEAEHVFPGLNYDDHDPAAGIRHSLARRTARSAIKKIYDKYLDTGCTDYAARDGYPGPAAIAADGAAADISTELR